MSDRKDDTSQVWLLNRNGGDAVQLTDVKQGVSSFEWSPDGLRMLLTITDARPADLDEEPLPNPRPWVIDRLQFKKDYVGYLDRHRTHIYVYDVSSKALRQVTDGDYDDKSPAWSPDGKRIAFVSNRTAEPDRNYNDDIWVVDVDDEDPKAFQLTTSTGEDSSPAWSPDGSKLVYLTKDPDVFSIYALPFVSVIDVDSRETRSFDELQEVQVFSPRFSIDGKSILGIAETRGEQRLIRVDVRSGRTEMLIGGEDVVSEFDLVSDQQIAVRVATPTLPGDVYLFGNRQLRKLGRTNDEVFDNIDLGEIRKVSLRTDDGTSIDSFVAFPPDYRPGRKYPGLLRVHGGPTSQYDYSFHSEAQLMAARGYIVVMPNPRGSSGYGQDFAMAIFQDWGGIDYGDVIAAMDNAIDEGWVDPDRTGVFGWSYGGIMTNHVITKTDRFKAAITGASSTLYMASYGHDEYQRWWEFELGLPWLAENREVYDRITPFFSLERVTTPTLIVCGEHDWNVPVQNSEQLYAALKRQGVPTELVVYPDQYHDFTVPSYNKDLYTRYFDWFEKYIPE